MHIIMYGMYIIHFLKEYWVCWCNVKYPESVYSLLLAFCKRHDSIWIIKPRKCKGKDIHHSVLYAERIWLVILVSLWYPTFWLKCILALRTTILTPPWHLFHQLHAWLHESQWLADTRNGFPVYSRFLDTIKFVYSWLKH